MTANRPWIASRGFDLGLIVGPPLMAVALVLAVPALRTGDTPVWAWVVFVLAIDVGHVYSSLYRTYFDPEELERRRQLYLLTPLFCWIAGVVLYSFGALVFWRILAYVAVYHFVRQQFGFVMVYRHRGGERGVFDRRLDKATIYATMLYPLVFWHADDGRQFAWFVQGDFLSLPAWTGSLAIWLYVAILAVFAGRQIQRFATGGGVNWGKIGIVAGTAAVWFVGIVFLNSDFAFTVTNVVAHGIPYMALVWLYGRRKWAAEGSWRTWIHRPAAAVAFVGLLVSLAWFEEGLWDVFVWRENAAVFGGWNPNFVVPEMALNLLVPLLTVPQATHYVIDGWIWKFDGSNPGLPEYLFGGRETADAPTA